MRFLADENFNNRILRRILQALPELDIIRAQDSEVYGADDPTVLEWAATEQRIVLTHDVKTMTKYAHERVRANLPMPGVIEIKERIATSQAVDELTIMLGAGTPQDFENMVLYIPM